MIERTRQMYTRRLRVAQGVRKGDEEALTQEHHRKEVLREVLKAQYEELGRLQSTEGLPGDLAKSLSNELDHSAESLR